jgi:regulator of replication initiation timing
MYWVGKAKGLTDFLSLSLLFSRLGGFRLRQVGEYLSAQDELHELISRSEALRSELDRLGGDGDQAQKIILENTSLKVQNRILTRTLSLLEERMREQTQSAPSDPEHEQKVNQALADLKTAYGEEIKL